MKNGTSLIVVRVSAGRSLHWEAPETTARADDHLVGARLSVRDDALRAAVVEIRAVDSGASGLDVRDVRVDLLDGAEDGGTLVPGSVVVGRARGGSDSGLAHGDGVGKGGLQGGGAGGGAAGVGDGALLDVGLLAEGEMITVMISDMVLLGGTKDENEPLNVLLDRVDLDILRDTTAIREIEHAVGSAVLELVVEVLDCKDVGGIDARKIVRVGDVDGLGDLRASRHRLHQVVGESPAIIGDEAASEGDLRASYSLSVFVHLIR